MGTQKGLEQSQGHTGSQRAQKGRRTTFVRGTNTDIDPKRIHGTDGTDETIPRTTVQSARILTQNSPSNLRNKTSSDRRTTLCAEQTRT